MVDMDERREDWEFMVSSKACLSSVSLFGITPTSVNRQSDHQ